MSGDSVPHGGSPRALCRQTRRVYWRPAAPCRTSAARCGTAAAQSPRATTRRSPVRPDSVTAPHRVRVGAGSYRVRPWVVTVMAPDAYLHGAGALLGSAEHLVARTRRTRRPVRTAMSDAWG